MNFLKDPDFLAVARERRGRIALGALAILGRTATAVWQPYLVGLAMDAAFTGAPSSDTVRKVLLYLGCGLGAAVCQYYMRLLLVAVSRDVELRIRSTLFRKLLSLSGAYFDKSRTGDLLSRLTSDVEAVRMGTGPALMYVADTGLRTTVALVVMFGLSPTLAAYALLPLLLMAFAMRGVLRRVQELSLKAQEEQGALSARATESFSGARVVKAFAREDAESARFDAMSRRYVGVNLDLAKARALFSCILESGLAASLALILLVGGRETLEGRFTVGGLAAFVAYLNMLVWPMIALGWVVALWQRAAASGERLAEIRREVPTIADPPTPHPAPARLLGAVSFRGLTFRREGATRNALSDVRLEIPAGSSLGVVGRTGSGKSTLVQFIARLVEPPPNTVFVDGVDVRSYRLDDLRRAVGFVPQETLLFSDTIRANVAFGLDGPPPPGRIEDAVRRSCLDEAIADFKDGLDAVVGERGVTLSGGQRQRAAIARALAIDPPILVLDDALSAVDAETEERILGRLSDVLRTRTSIVVSHRASAVGKLDRVVVLRDGAIVDYGAPDELVEKGGAFAELVRLQRTEEELETL
jgi:ATP-binding cassette, subfamily B, multidrug efflux pump